MNNTYRTAALAAAVVVMLAPWPALAHDGHAEEAAPMAADAHAAPRFAAESENFELVGVVAGKQLTLYLDRYADGSPVKEARIELDIGGRQVVAERHADGEFAAVLPEELAPGLIPVSATILAGAESDLLAADLDIHDEASAAAAAGLPAAAALLAGGAVVLAVLLAAWIAVRRRLPGGGAA